MLKRYWWVKMEDKVAAEVALLQEQKEDAAEQVMEARLLSQHAALTSVTTNSSTRQRLRLQPITSVSVVAQGERVSQRIHFWQFRTIGSWSLCWSTKLWLTSHLLSHLEEAGRHGELELDPLVSRKTQMIIWFLAKLVSATRQLRRGSTTWWHLWKSIETMILFNPDATTNRIMVNFWELWTTCMRLTRLSLLNKKWPNTPSQPGKLMTKQRPKLCKMHCLGCSHQVINYITWSRGRTRPVVAVAGVLLVHQVVIVMQEVLAALPRMIVQAALKWQRRRQSQRVMYKLWLTSRLHA